MWFGEQKEMSRRVVALVEKPGGKLTAKASFSEQSAAETLGLDGLAAFLGGCSEPLLPWELFLCLLELRPRLETAASLSCKKEAN